LAQSQAVAQVFGMRKRRPPQGAQVKIGDLVKLTESVGIIVEVAEWATLVQWLDDGTIEDIENYYPKEAEVISES